MNDPQTLAEAFRYQARWCRDLGSILYAELLERSAHEMIEPGPLRDLLASDAQPALRSNLALRFMGAMHRLALCGQAPALASLFASPAHDSECRWRIFRTTLEEHQE